MRIVVKASEEQKAEWLQKTALSNATVEFIKQSEPLLQTASADAYFLLTSDEKDFTEIKNIQQPVFVNAVTETLNELPGNCMRINAWNSFLKREVIEIVAAEENKNIAVAVMNMLNWKYIFIPDIRGMIAARAICMIINEAYFALEDKVSTKDEIDTAMKLGTNYPYGPFEWSKKIGLKNVYQLLNVLSKEDHRYIAAPLLKGEVAKL